MATKRIFTINGSSISNMIKGLFANISNSRFVATSNVGNTIFNLPLLLVLILAFAFPVSLIVGFFLIILLKIKISIEREITKDIILLEK